MLTARVHNALVRRIRCRTRFAARLDPRLGDLLRADPAAVAVLAGLSGDAVIEAPDRSVAADLLVLLDHLNLHAGTRLSVVPVGPSRYRVHGSGIEADNRAVPRPPAEYLPWPGRIERIAVITRDRPETLAAGLDAYADNLARFGRGYVGIVVYDDSGAGARHAVRDLVEGRGLRYVGPDEKHALRTEIEAGLPGPAPERAEALDALLGRREVDGTWTGSAAAQRNWAILSAAGSRVLVCDDDVRPAVLDAPLDALRAAAGRAVATGSAGVPGDLLEHHLRTSEVEAWPTDLLGQLEDTDARLVSAAYTGHPDRRTALWLERFFEPSDESVDVLGTGIPPHRVRRGAPAATARKFRGAAFASSGSLDGLEFAVRRGRNEDFSLALSARITSRGRREPTEAAGAHILHLRGPRATSTFTAHREEREGNAVNAIVRRIADAHAVTDRGSFDAVAFRVFGLAHLDAELDREFATADLGSELFDEGLSYRDRAGKPDGRWLDDPATARADLLREGVARLRDGLVPADAVLMECAQVLVPQGFLTTLRPPAMRRALARLSDVERAEAVRCLADEARYLTSTRGPQQPGPQQPGPQPERVARKAEQARELADHIERELGLRHHRSEPEAREAFRADVRRRVRAEVRLYLTAIPYVATVRAELTRVAR
ncbi:hypothetical protein [Virgisporangium aurantiacum]|uniref:Uncharacterized protein n=1 Tax=Virgisporangium aurantiacum TaxID=175570 RepID=A0A8J4E7J5_9ACTN|nr:hypothetical protein [Virgisporangium aurantiacum]GIJ64273.1 hypothetical protein Vau01_117890 [Virgisporangium aurantiacum]